MSSIPVFTAVRIIPRESDFLNRKVGLRGEVFFDRDSNTLRIYDGNIQGGVSLAKNDLTNISNSVFAAKATAAGVGGGGGGSTTVSVGASLPSSPSSGNLWLNTNNGSLYVYINDGDSNQWIQPAFSTPDLTDYATKAYVDAVTANAITEQFEIYVAADDSTQRRINTGNLIQFIGAGGISTSSDADGNITITGGGSTGNVTFSTTTIDTTDSSAITFTPAVLFNSDVTVENDLIVSNSITAATLAGSLDWSDITNTPTTVAGYGITDFGTFIFTGSTLDTNDSSGITVVPAVTFNSDVTVENELIVTNSVTAGTFVGNLTATSVITSAITTSRVRETIVQKIDATGTVVHDLSESSVFYHTSIDANFTANFTNLAIASGQGTNISLILVQGGTGYIPNAVQIEGAAQTINWQDSTEPSGNINKIDIVTFSFVRIDNTYTVFGALTSFGT